jgi:hypothetical protein
VEQGPELKDGEALLHHFNATSSSGNVGEEAVDLWVTGTV